MEQGRRPAKTAAEIVQGLEVTGRTIQDRLVTGSAAGALTEEETGMVQAIWGLQDHDLPYAGQLSLLLRSMDMPGIDISTSIRVSAG